MVLATGTAAFYDSVYHWCLAERALAAAANASHQAIVIGINGPQGCGKSTMVRALAERFAGAGIRAVAVSVDDFYLTREEQCSLAARYPRNPYLQQRGFPGTHDVALGVETVGALQALRPGQDLAVPVYDKALHAGQGDRAAAAAWPRVAGPVSVVLWEGWLLGFRPVGDAACRTAELAEVDRLLAPYAAWNRRLTAMLQLRAEVPELSIDWRAEAEAQMRAAGRPGMSAAKVRSYAALFQAAYAVYPEGLAAAPLCPGHQLTIRIGRDRLPLESGQHGLA